MHLDVILTILRKCAQTRVQTNLQCLYFLSSALGFQLKKFPVCERQWCHMVSCVDCIKVVCCAIRARSQGVTLASSLILAKFRVPEEPVSLSAC